MAYITNLGSMGTPQESTLSGLPQALATGVKLGLDIKNNRALEEARQQALTLKKQEMQTEIAKMDRSDEAKNRKLAEDTLKRISLTAMGKSPMDRELFLKSEPIVQITKHLIKKYLPENVDPQTGQLITLPLKYFPKTKEEAIQMKVDTQSAVDKLKAGEIPTVTEINSAMNNVETIHTLGQIDDNTFAKAMKFYGSLLPAAESRIQKANPSFFQGSSEGTSAGDKANQWLIHALGGAK